MRIEPDRPLTSVILRWFCDGCGNLIGDGTGYIEVVLAEVFAVERGRREARLRAEERAAQSGHPAGMISLADLELIHDANWHAWHQECDPDPTNAVSDSYWVDIERVRSLGQLLDLHAHVGEKTWAKHTDLKDLRRHLPDLYGTC